MTQLNNHQRMAICKACPLLAELDRCKICGCFMQMKVLFPAATCPAGKW